MGMRLIINADDFGFSRGVTNGILRSHREGVLTSTTLMTTMPDRDRAIDLAGETKTLGVGIHLCLTQGQALTKCGRLLDGAGNFGRSLPGLFWKLRSGAAQAQAHDEFVAQIQYALRRGLRPTHVDSHKHVGHFPWLQDAMIEACVATGVGWVRCARETKVQGLPGLSAGYRAQRHFAEGLAKKIAAAGLRTTDWFFGLSTTGRTGVEVYETLASSGREGLGELMVHPGYVDGITMNETRLMHERVVEMEALCDARVRAALTPAVKLVRDGE